MILCKVFFFDDATQPASSSGYKYICAKHRESPSASLLGNSQRFFSLSSLGSPPRLLIKLGWQSSAKTSLSHMETHCTVVTFNPKEEQWGKRDLSTL